MLNIYSFRYYCPPGQSSSTPSLYTCLPGHYCPRGSAASIPCENGTYQNSSTQEVCLPCPEGFYCDPAEGPVINPKPCPTGHFCPPLTSYRKSFPCKAGTYAPDEGYATSSQCKLCTPANYCGTDGLSAVSGQCSAGHYCFKGAKMQAPFQSLNASGWVFDYYNDLCPKGYYCPSNTSIPKPCKAGSYSINSGLKDENECQPCPAGKYCNIVGLKELIDPPKCSSGYVCIGGSSTPNPNDNIHGYICPKGFYCPPGKCPTVISLRLFSEWGGFLRYMFYVPIETTV